MHTFIKFVLCVGIALFASVLVWANSGNRAVAQEVACQFNLTDAKLGLLVAETPHVVLPWNERDHFVAMLESATGFNFPEITNVLIAQLQGGGILRTGDSWVSYCSDLAFGAADGAAERRDGGMRGVYQHCAEKHLHRYLAEFDFRHNRRVALGVNDTARADSVLTGAVGKRLTYETTSAR